MYRRGETTPIDIVMIWLRGVGLSLRLEGPDGVFLAVGDRRMAGFYRVGADGGKTPVGEAVVAAAYDSATSIVLYQDSLSSGEAITRSELEALLRKEVMDV